MTTDFVSTILDEEPRELRRISTEDFSHMSSFTAAMRISQNPELLRNEVMKFLLDCGSCCHSEMNVPLGSL